MSRGGHSCFACWLSQPRHDRARRRPPRGAERDASTPPPMSRSGRSGQGRRAPRSRPTATRPQGQRNCPSRRVREHRPPQSIRGARRLGRPSGLRRSQGERALQDAQREAAIHAGRADGHPPAQRLVRLDGGRPRQIGKRRHRGGHPCRRHSAAEGQRHCCAQAARRRQPQHAGNLQFDVWQQIDRPNHSPWSKPGIRAAPSTSIRCGTKPATSAPSSRRCRARSTTSGSTSP